MLRILRSLFFDNFFIKLFSLLFAVVLWLYVVTKGSVEANFVVPLELKDLPQNMVVVGDVPNYVDVRLRGPEEMLRGVTSRGLRASINLKDAPDGETTYHLSGTNINTPPNVAVTNTNPDIVKLRLEPLIKKNVQVRPVLLGKPAAGYRVYKVSVTPETVMAEGPKSSLSRLSGFVTVAVNVEDIKQGFEKTLPIEPPAVSHIMLDEDNVEVTLSVTRTRKQKGGDD